MRNGLPREPRAVVTGAGSGLGRAFCVELAGRYAHIVVSDIDPTNAEETASLVRKAGARAHVVPCDVRDPAAVDALRDEAEKRLGSVDLIVNNAGVAVSGRVGEVPLADWKWVVDVNLWGVIYGCHSFVPAMVARGSGFVINVASAAGLLSPPMMGPYNVTKAGVVALSETLAGEVRGRGVKVSVLCPTFFQTNILHAGRGGDEEMKNVAAKAMERSKIQANDVARYAIECVERGHLYAVPMTDGRTMWRLKRVMPGRFPQITSAVMKSAVFRKLMQ